MFESLIPRGTMGRPEEICDGRAVSCFRRSELREWGGVVCRRRLLRNLNRRVTKSRLRNTVPSLGGKRPTMRSGRRRIDSSLTAQHRSTLCDYMRVMLLPGTDTTAASCA